MRVLIAEDACTLLVVCNRISGWCVIRGVNDEAIWRKHHDEIVRYATVLVGPADAEDLVSAVVVRILANQGSLSGLKEPALICSDRC